jgi:hypothetical protein
MAFYEVLAKPEFGPRAKPEPLKVVLYSPNSSEDEEPKATKSYYGGTPINFILSFFPVKYKELTLIIN